MAGLYVHRRFADALNISPRSLQRKLCQEGTNYQTILNETRHALAVQYLTHSKFSITETAYLLGFTSSSNFSRTFKSWTSMTPTQFRTGN